MEAHVYHYKGYALNQWEERFPLDGVVQVDRRIVSTDEYEDVKDLILSLANEENDDAYVEVKIESLSYLN